MQEVKRALKIDWMRQVGKMIPDIWKMVEIAAYQNPSSSSPICTICITLGSEVGNPND
jgi:hypothetical protein